MRRGVRAKLSELVLSAIALVLMPCLAWAQSQSPRLVAASTGSQMWLVLPQLESGPLLIHHAAAMDGMYASVAAELDERPEAVAAHGDTVWLLFEPAEGKRRVVSLTAQRIAATNYYEYLPRGSLQVERSLPSDAPLLAMVADEDGLVALLGARAADQSASGKPILLRLGRSGWIEQPSSAQLAGACGLVPTSASGNEVMMWYRADATPIDGVWPIAQLECQGDRLEARWTRGPADPLIASARIPHGPWAVLGMGSRVLLLRAEIPGTPAGMDTGMPFDYGVIVLELGTSGGLHPMQVLTPLGLSSTWQIAGTLLLFASLVVLFAAAFRRVPLAVTACPSGYEAAPLLARGGAFLIDWIPAAALASIWCKVSLADAMRPPVLSQEWSQAEPAVLGLLLCLLCSSVVETVFGSSGGKLILGLRVVTASEDRPSRIRIFIRAWLRLLLLVMPTLVFLTVIRPQGRGLPESWTATTVARRRLTSSAHANRPEAGSNRS